MSCMKLVVRSLRLPRFSTLIGTATIAFLGQPFLAGASLYTIAGGNASVSIDPSSPALMNQWLVDGQNVLDQQSFWFRVGSGSKAVPFSFVGSSTTQIAGFPSYLTTTYTGTGFSMQVNYLLSGGSPGSGTADLSEQIKVQNTSSTALVFHFYQFSDFNTRNLRNPSVNLGHNLRGLFGEALVSGDGTPVSRENLDTSVAPGANEGEANNGNNTIESLTSVPNYMLNNNTTSLGPNPTWAFEWDFTNAPGSTFIISKDLNVAGMVPEPGTFGLFGLGLIGLAIATRRKTARS